MCQKEYRRRLKRTQLPTLWTVPDEMWQKIRPLLPSEKELGTPGRPSVPFRKVLNGVLFVLRTAAATGKPSASLLRLRFDRPPTLPAVDQGGDNGRHLVELLLRWYETDAAGSTGSGKRRTPSSWPLRWEAKLRGLIPPTSRKVRYQKRHLLVDGRGAPLAVHLSEAHRHDRP